MAELGLKLRAPRPLEFPQQRPHGQRDRASKETVSHARASLLLQGEPGTALLAGGWLMALWFCSHAHLLSLLRIHLGCRDILLSRGDPQEVTGQLQGYSGSMICEARWNTSARLEGAKFPQSYFLVLLLLLPPSL